MNEAAGDITSLLARWRNGDDAAEAALVERIYPQLRELARRRLRPGGPLTLSATELAHEAYFKLIAQRDGEFQNRSHFFAIAAHVMRRLVVDLVRERQALKRGGEHVLVNIDLAGTIADEAQPDGASVLDLDRLLAQLERIDARAARVTELRFFGGLSVEDVADCEGLSSATVKRSWSFARAWLKDQLLPLSGS